MATLGEVVQTLRDRLDDDSGSPSIFWGEEEIRRYLNEGRRDLARRVECVQTLATIATISGTQQYTMPADVVRVYRVEFQDASSQVWPLEYRDFNSLDQIWGTWQRTTTSSRPYLYTMWGYPPNLELTLYPTPVDTGNTVRVFYYSVPDNMAVDGTDDDTDIGIPTGWEDAIVQYAEYVALRKDKAPEWQEAKQLYEQKITELTERSRRWTDQAGMIDWNTSTIPGWLYNPD